MLGAPLTPATPMPAIRRARVSARMDWVGWAGLSAALLSSPADAGAAPACTGGGQTYVLTLPATLRVLPTAPVGTALTGWIDSPAVNDHFTCPANADAAIGSRLPGAREAGLDIQSDGATYAVRQTGLAGIGMAIRRDVNIGNRVYAGWLPAGTPGHAASWQIDRAPGIATQPGGTQAMGLRFGVMLVKTGPVAAGTLPSEIVAEGATMVADVPQMDPPPMTFKVSAVAVQPFTCRTPDVVVDLGTHMTHRFAGPGSTTPPRTFQFALHDCPGGLTGITYRIDARTAVVAADKAVVALNTASGATGIGVQLLDAAGRPMLLGTPIEVPGYDTRRDADYAIPLGARLYQTGSVVTAGAVRAEVTVTLDYR